MRCPYCREVLPEDSSFCPFCGRQLDAQDLVVPANEEKHITATERDRITAQQHYFDEDYGYSEDNPLVVSSVSAVGCYLAGFRTPDGKAFTWKREPYTGAPNVDKYSLYVEGALYKTVFFNHAGNDTDHMPRGLCLDRGAFDAAKRGLSPEEYAAELETIKARQEAERIAAEQRKKAEEEEQERKAQQEKEDKERRAEQKAARRQRAKKIWKRIAAIFLLCAVVCGVIFGGRAIYRWISYKNAIKAMESGDYESAVAKFSDLGEYIDSQAKLDECYYLGANALFDAGEYEEAIEQYAQVKNFKDASDDIKACNYQIGLEQLESKDYESAIETFRSLNNYSNAKEMLARSHCGLAVELFNKRDYVNAYKNYSSFNTINLYTPIDNIDLSFVPELKKEYAKERIPAGDKAEVARIVRMLEELLGEHVEVASLLNDARLRLNELTYQSAIKKLNAKAYEAAATEFGEIADYSDAREKRYEAMYAYVESEKYKYLKYLGPTILRLYNSTGSRQMCYNYAKELSDAGYRDGRQVYADLTAWKVSIIMNDSETDKETALFSMSKWDTTYAHIQLYGGPLEGETKLRYVFTMSNGNTVKGTWDYAMRSGSTTWCCCYFNQPEYAPTGTCKVKIYEVDSGKLLGEEQIRITR